jgi:hypothetical protein
MTASPTAKPRPCSAAGLEPERRTAREHEGIDPLHGVGKVEQRALADTGAAAAHIDRRHRRSVENHRRGARRRFLVVGVTDADAGYVGEEVFQGFTNVSSLRGEKRRSNPVSTEFNILDCFASLAMTAPSSDRAACNFTRAYDPLGLISV